MGLDFNHGNAHWSYSGFHRFRKRLASALGINLTEMEGFGEMDYEKGTRVCGTVPWDTVNDAIVPLLHHSDCDGDLSPEACAQVAPRLRELVAPWPDDDYDKRNALMLAEAMEQCAAGGVSLEFC